MRTFNRLSGLVLFAAAAFGQQPPAQLTIPAGTWIAVRTDETISTGRNKAGDYFTATLSQPIIVDGFVVARRGQTVEGRVTDVVKAGRVKGTSKLGLELRQLGTVDGQQLSIATGMSDRRGRTSVGDDATAVGAAAGVGALIGAAADDGFGAGMGAIAGGGAAAMGVLLTRGRDTVVYPETVLRFRLANAVTVNTERAAQAFREVQQSDYENTQVARRAPEDRGLSRRYPVFSPYGFPGGGVWIISGRRVLRGGGWGRWWY